MVVKKSGNKYCVYDSSGEKKLGCHETKKRANSQLAAIEINKNKRKK